MAKKLKTYRVSVIESVGYEIEVVATDSGKASDLALELYGQSENPTADFSSYSEGAQVFEVEELNS